MSRIKYNTFVEPKDSQPSQPPKDEAKPAFVIGGVNETSAVRNLTEINGIPIAHLEEAMRGGFNSTPEDIEDFKETFAGTPPNTFGERALTLYVDIFLGPEESLLDILAQDNDAVLSLGLTHQQLAEFLDNFTRIQHPTADASEFVYGQHQGTPFGTFTIGNRSYSMEKAGGRGGENSPFNDDLSGAMDFFVTCLDDSSKIQFGSMQPELIRRYGFYEGRGTAYRIDPRELAEFAGFIPKQDK